MQPQPASAPPPTAPAPPTPPSPPGSPATARDPVRTAVGLLLVLPALIGLVVGYGWPTVRTLVLSFQDRSFLFQPGEFTGVDNYRAAANRETLTAYLQTVPLSGVPLLALLVVGPLLAYAAHRAGRAGRWTTRVVLAVLMVCYAPAAIGLAWVADHGTGEWQTWAAVSLATFGLAAGVGVTLFLAVLRGRRPGRSGWPAGLVVAGVLVLALNAVTLQLFAYPILLGLDTPAPLLFQVGFELAAFGQAAAHGAVLTGVLALLGLAAAAVMIASQLRLSIDPAPPEAPTPPDPPATGSAGSAGAAVGTGIGLLVVLVVTGFGLWPWLSRLGQLETSLGPSSAQVLVNTWLPPLISTVVGVGLAAAAGFGIGALRPFGRWSELLLLPFAPWLFVGLGPLLPAKFAIAVNGLFGDRAGTFPGLVPTVWLVVPGLFLFTLLFRGLVERYPRPGSGNYRRLLAPALPMLALVAGATWLVQSQSLAWPLVMAASNVETAPGPLLAILESQRAGPDGSPLGLVLPIPAVLVFAAGLAVLQLRYLDRLAIRVGRGGEPAGGVRQNH